MQISEALMALKDHRTGGDEFFKEKVASLDPSAARFVRSVLEDGEVPCPPELPDESFALVIKTADGMTHRRFPIHDGYNALASAVVVSQLDETAVSPEVIKLAQARVGRALQRFAGDSGAAGFFGGLASGLEKAASSIDMRKLIGASGGSVIEDQTHAVKRTAAEAFAAMSGVSTSSRQRFVVDMDAPDGMDKVAMLKVAKLDHLLNDRPAQHFRMEIALRRGHAEDHGLEGFLDDMLEKTASRQVSMPEAVELLSRFDTKVGIVGRYGTVFRDPEHAVFGDGHVKQATAEPSDFEKLAENKAAISARFGEAFFTAISSDEGAYDSLPEPHKAAIRALMR